MPKSAPSNRSSQDYLRAILLLSRNDAPVSTGEVSRYFGVAPASVTEMLDKLEAGGYVRHSRYHGTTLTRKGTRDALRTTRKHRLLEKFLSDVLHVRKERVHAQACEMEHVLSDEAEESMCRLLNHPARCPDDSQIIPACDLPIFSCDECMKMDEEGVEGVRRRSENLISLAALEPGASGRVRFVRGDRKMVGELRRLGLTDGAFVSLRAIRSGGGLELTVRGSESAISGADAANVFLKESN